MAAGTGGVCLTKRDKPMLVPPYFGLSLSQFDMKNVTAKGIICFLGLLVVSMWLLAHSGKQEGVVEKLVLLLMFLLSDGFFFFVKQKDRRQLFSLFVSRKVTRQLFSPTIFMAVCPPIIASAYNISHLLLKWCPSLLSCFAFLLRFLIYKYLGNASVVA